MRRFRLLLLLFICLKLGNLSAQYRIRLGFYNLENFFDVFYDSTLQYNDFTPQGIQHWDYDRFQLKRNNIFKTLAALGEGDFPALMGFCEIENEIVLRELLYKTPLKKFDYQYVHYPSADRRGIDVGLIYRTNELQLMESQSIRILDKTDTSFRTRDILYAAFLKDSDTLRFFVNHWPSRYSGTLATDEKRMLVASLLKHKTDSIVKRFPGAKLILMGDFNDCAEDASLSKGLKVCSQQVEQGATLFNLFHLNADLGFQGPLKHEQQWQIFDQIIVSGSLLKNKRGWIYKQGSAGIFHAPFLLEADEKYAGVKTFRTYTGPKYSGGFSDHLPVYIDLIYK